MRNRSATARTPTSRPSSTARREAGSYSLASARQLNGKELSYNNIQDANAALSIVREFDEPFCVGLKHMNPCGAAVGRDAADAWTKAYEADKVSIFGGIVATNRPVTKEAAELMKPVFLEIIMAPPSPTRRSRYSARRRTCVCWR